jgi:hypothetical protein
MRPTICSLFEPHYKQNLYTNPKRTAKSFFAPLLIDTPPAADVQNKFCLSKNIFCTGSELLISPRELAGLKNWAALKKKPWSAAALGFSSLHQSVPPDLLCAQFPRD